MTPKDIKQLLTPPTKTPLSQIPTQNPNSSFSVRSNKKQPSYIQVEDNDRVFLKSLSQLVPGKPTPSKKNKDLSLSRSIQIKQSCPKKSVKVFAGLSKVSNLQDGELRLKRNLSLAELNHQRKASKKLREMAAEKEVKYHLMKSYVDQLNKHNIQKAKISLITGDPLEQLPFTSCLGLDDIRRFEEIFEDTFLKREQKVRARMLKLYGDEKPKYSLTNNLNGRDHIQEYVDKIDHARPEGYLEEEFRELDRISMIQAKVYAKVLKKTKKNIISLRKMHNKWMFPNLANSYDHGGVVMKMGIDESAVNHKNRKIGSQSLLCIDSNFQNKVADIGNIKDEQEILVEEINHNRMKTAKKRYTLDANGINKTGVDVGSRKFKKFISAIRNSELAHVREFLDKYPLAFKFIDEVCSIN